MMRLEELFDVWYGVNLEYVNCIESPQGIPFVSRTRENNGVTGYVELLDGVRANPANTLSIAAGGSVLSTFFHDYEYYSGRDIYILRPKQALSACQMLYYCHVIEQNKFRYNYGRQANRTLKDTLLPSPLEIPSYVEVVSLEIPFKKKKHERSYPLYTDNWQWFQYNQLFRIVKGKRLTKADMFDGNIPFIGSTEYSNGVTNCIGNDEHVHPQNLITVSYNGSIAEAFYQNKPFVVSDDVNVFYPKFSLNPYIGLFLCVLISKEKYRYNYGRKWKKETMEQSLIKLPVTKNGSPDWGFMENYIKSLDYSEALE